VPLEPDFGTSGERFGPERSASGSVHPDGRERSDRGEQQSHGDVDRARTEAEVVGRRGRDERTRTPGMPGSRRRRPSCRLARPESEDAGLQRVQKMALAMPVVSPNRTCSG
jgi:hypothetical protein